MLGRAAATLHRDAVDNQRMAQEIGQFAGDIRAVDRVIIVHYQRAVAVIDFQAAVQTTAHAVVGTTWHPQNAVLLRRVADPASD